MDLCFGSDGGYKGLQDPVESEEGDVVHVES